MLGSPFFAAVFTRSRRRSKLNYSSSGKQTRKRPYSVANADAHPPPLKQQFPNVLRFFANARWPSDFLFGISSVLLFSVNVEAEEPASIELAPAPNNRDSVRFPAQANSTVPSCLLHDHGTRTPCCFSKVVLRPNGNIVNVSPRPGGVKKDVNTRQQIEAGHQLTGFCRDLRQSNRRAATDHA